MPQAGNARARQRGWAAVVTLLAVLIVAVLAGILLKQQGPTAASASRAAPDAGVARVDAEGASNPMERAKALEQSVKEQAADHDKRIDDAAK